MKTLYVVGTPIGNLADVSLRAIETLKSVDLIACEDTRHTKILLDRYQIETSAVSYHQHSSIQKIDWLVDQLKQGRDIVLVTDAGTPGIADPGGVLVARIHEYNEAARDPINIVSIPGASSLATALSVSGFPADQFLFLGFLPKKKGRQTLLNSLPILHKEFKITTIAFFESPQRVEKTLGELTSLYVGTQYSPTVCLCRELTKKFEEIWRGPLSTACQKVSGEQKGEFVIVLHV